MGLGHLGKECANLISSLGRIFFPRHDHLRRHWVALVKPTVPKFTYKLWQKYFLWFPSKDKNTLNAHVNLSTEIRTSLETQREIFTLTNHSNWPVLSPAPARALAGQWARFPRPESVHPRGHPIHIRVCRLQGGAEVHTPGGDAVGRRPYCPAPRMCQPPGRQPAPHSSACRR